MEISYNPLFKLLIDKGMKKKTDLAKEADLTGELWLNYQNNKLYQWKH